MKGCWPRVVLPVALIQVLLVAVAAGQRRPEASLTPLKDLVRLECKDGVFDLSWCDGVPVAARRISAEGPEGRWLVEPLLRPGDNGGILITRGSPGTKRPDQFTEISVSSGAGQLMILAARAIKPAIVRIVQRPGRGVNLLVLEGGNRREVAAEDLLDLRAQQPGLVREVVLPILEQITGDADLLLPGATDVYRVFDEIVADEQTTAKVERLLPELAATSAVDRVAATDQLEALGAAAIPALLRVAREALIPEAAVRVELVLSRSARRRIDDPAKQRDDAMFLVDCLEFSDARVRAAAKARIEQLRGAPISIPWSGTGSDWSRTADGLRLMLAARQPVPEPRRIRLPTTEPGFPK